MDCSTRSIASPSARSRLLPTSPGAETTRALNTLASTALDRAHAVRTGIAWLSAQPWTGARRGPALHVAGHPDYRPGGSWTAPHRPAFESAHASLVLNTQPLSAWPTTGPRHNSGGPGGGGARSGGAGAGGGGEGRGRYTVVDAAGGGVGAPLTEPEA